jgi:short-subunit dehydrogenase
LGLLTGRVAVVTGASSGIGRECAVTLAAMGARVGVLARRRQELDILADDILDRGGEALPARCDVTDQTELAATVDYVANRLGAIDIVVNSAGIAIPQRALDARTEDLRKMMEVNYFGTVNVIQAVLPSMMDGAHGNIVNIGSTAGRRGDETLAGYCASKFALVGYTEALRKELFGSGVTASLVMPGPVDTKMLDNPQWQARAQVLAGTVIPPGWVAAAVVAAIVYGLYEVDVPLGAGTALKLASLLPEFIDPWFAIGSRLIELLNFWANSQLHGGQQW